VRDNALCIGAIDFYAKLLQIIHIALPVDDDDDVANKRYVLQSVKILKDRRNKKKRCNAPK